MWTPESFYSSDISSTTGLNTNFVGEALISSERICTNDSNLGALENNGLFNPSNSNIEGILRINEALICHDDSLSILEISSISHNFANNEDSSNENAEDKFKHPKFVLSELKGKIDNCTY